MHTPTRSLNQLELRCPPLPHTLVEALNLTKDPERINIQSVTTMLEKDPAVVARLLQTANSTFYGLQRTISSADRAVVMLGPIAVVGVVVGMSMLRLRSVLSGPAGPCFNRLINHSVATGFLTRYLIEDLPKDEGRAPSKLAQQGVSFTAGLLHDFGKIILVYNFQEKGVALYDQQGLRSLVQTDDVREMENLVFGADHTEAGEFAAHKLSFPDMLARVIRYHHTPERTDGDETVQQLVRATALADLAARGLGYAFTSPYAWEKGLDAAAWAQYVPFAPPSVETPERLAELVHAQKESLDLYVKAFQSPAQG
jgi:HD-like signal output (HDOD) protein